ncbi:MAG: Rieske 2Fe-2S domain-containing protein [Candidatus Thermoplasmatota archaeon]|jgi:nitrite reductase/ring-hydroxylating ferredoxin subunit|nr:Rieske 2Fe-2S domain-containing protein [Candidatus Thermoplasmatota archaeon]MCL5987985.1 Rieske 2Fe-2S domain-containing protein [Candidatus Thermoplasmatota archaeon]
MKIETPNDGFDSKGRKRVKSTGLDITIFLNDGKSFACNSACPHKGGPLFIGKVVSKGLMCPSHHIIFDIENGKIVENPIPESMGEYRNSGDLKMYPLRMEGNNFIIETED